MGQNQVFSIQIADLNHSGEGVGRKDGRVVFVPYAAPGDIAVVRIVEERRGFARAELLSLERESPDRVLPPCPVYLQCGGCQLQHISYDAQLAYKKRRVEQALRRIGKLEGVPVGDCLPAPRVFHYRNKARFSYSTRPATEGLSEVFQRWAPNHDGAGACKPCVAGGARDVRSAQDTQVARDDRDGWDGWNDGDARSGRSGFVSGFYGRRTHDVVDFNECLIQNHTNNRVFQALNAVVAERAIPVYGSDILDPVAGGPHTVGGCGARSAAPYEGTLKHLVVRCAGDGKQALAVLVGFGAPLRDVGRVAYELMLAVPELVGVVEEVEPGSKSGEEAGGGRGPSRGAERRQPRRAASRVVRGAGFLRERILGLELMVSADSFLQVNPEGMEVLYREAVRAADLSGGEVAVDAYCGVGSISLALARECRHVYGIEEAGAAVADARRNAGLNRLTNCTFIAGRVEDVLSARSGRAPGRPGRTAHAGGEGDRQAAHAELSVGVGAAASPRCERAESRGYAPRRGRQAGRETSALPRQVDVVVLDPPRAGCDRRALHALAHLEPSRIVYVACDPETLARDLTLLAGIGYRPTQVQPVDMFPQTSHVECVVRLNRF